MLKLVILVEKKQFICISLFSKPVFQMSHDELWDDTLLIQQYDAAMDHVKHKVFKQEGSHLVDLENNESKVSMFIS